MSTFIIIKATTIWLYQARIILGLFIVVVDHLIACVDNEAFENG
jgi:hypothetical protein